MSLPGDTAAEVRHEVEKARPVFTFRVVEVGGSNERTVGLSRGNRDLEKDHKAGPGSP